MKFSKRTSVLWPSGQEANIDFFVYDNNLRCACYEEAWDVRNKLAYIL